MNKLITFVSCLLSVATLSAQEAVLQGRVEHPKEDDYLQLYVTGTVDVKTIELDEKGEFSCSVDLFEPTRCILFWKGRSDDDWSFALWMQPDSTVSVTLDVQKVKKVQRPTIAIRGACAARSHYTNLYYQTFELQNMLDSNHLSDLPDFRSCQTYIQQTLLPLGESLLNVTDDEFGEGEEPEPEEHLSAADDEDEEAADAGSAARFCERERNELDLRQVEAEFAYAILSERSGRSMELDKAFVERLAEIDTTDVDQAHVMALMTEWSVVAHPDRYAPLTDEAAQLRCLSLYVADEDVRNAVAEYIMQHFFLRVQMDEVNPSSPSCRPLYEELRRVSTDDSYEEFIETQLQMMDRPDLFEEDKDEEENDEGEDMQN